jgi:hypothetical protein
LRLWVFIFDSSLEINDHLQKNRYMFRLSNRLPRYR